MKQIVIALLLATAPAIAQQGPAPDLNKLFFQQFDTDQDGQVSAEEFLRPTKKQFEYMDSDRNGSLDRVEVEAFNQEMQQRMQEMRQRMQQQAPQRP